jgi:hypothetical protein
MDYDSSLHTPDELEQLKCYQDIRRREPNGGTELLPALKHVIELIKLHGTMENAILVLITDGQVANESEILSHLKTCPGLRLHAIGIDTVVNEAFLKSLARQHQGTCTLCSPQEDITSIITLLGHRVVRPVLTQLELSPGAVPADGSLPVLFAGDDLLVPVKLDGPHTSLTLTGQRPDGTRHSSPILLRTSDDIAIPLFWVKNKISHLVGGNNGTEQLKHKEEVVALSIQYNIPCFFTSYVAWDDQEEVPIASVQVHQPNLEPAGWDATGFLSAPTLMRSHFTASTAGMTGMIYGMPQGLCASAGTICEGLIEKPHPAEEKPDTVLSWDKELAGVAVFQADPGRRIIQILHDWSLESKRVLRRSLLKKLARDIIRAGDDLELIRLILHAFRKSHLTTWDDLTAAINLLGV